MIIKMADNDDTQQNNNRKPVNGINKQNGDLDESLTALLASSLLATEPEELNDLEDIAGEYSSLSNTIDELNNYLDRWEQRHDNLRAQIREALRESQEEKSNQATQINEEKTNDADSNPKNPNDSSPDSI
ncbi:uncharacterized protein LOC131930382 [Physella acuta]|uniref:uncharacterized protein LOC131930382 n=1 Tax=Physella acuta TaxID=109671 RepID=UPI0027DBA51C|nr:uncharacterized protein LOC131930382 [Physella acuta]